VKHKVSNADKVRKIRGSIPRTEEVNQQLSDFVAQRVPTRQIAEKMGVSQPTVCDRLKELGFDSGAKLVRWTPGDDEELRRLADKGYTAAAIAGALQRTKAGVNLRAGRIGVKFKNRDKWSDPRIVPGSRSEYQRRYFDDLYYKIKARTLAYSLVLCKGNFDLALEVAADVAVFMWRNFEIFQGTSFEFFLWSKTLVSKEMEFKELDRRSKTQNEYSYDSPGVLSYRLKDPKAATVNQTELPRDLITAICSARLLPKERQAIVLAVETDDWRAVEALPEVAIKEVARALERMPASFLSDVYYQEVNRVRFVKRGARVVFGAGRRFTRPYARCA
jgi:hypothetical protein